MPLASGARLEHYEISGPLGAGGMGEVYRALDTKLKREVALKILPPVFAQDPARLARFEREAQALAALNHPNIAAIYGLENADGVRFLVLELVEGPTLAERIRSVALPLEEALHIARQIADALEAAHDKGIVHRDLKPANVKVTPDGKVKVLDFGLAAMTQPHAASSYDPGTSPTLTMGATQAGVILGTAAYMSPEQARGQAVDKRADIWSFGVVLYEMVTGKKLFSGDTISDTLASVLKEKPDLESVPVSVRRLIESCLEKDPKKRLRDIGDVWRLLDDVGQGHALPSRGMAPRHSRLWPAAAGLFAFALAAVAFIHFREKPPAAEVVRFEIPAPPNATLGDFMTVSPDGRKIAFIASATGGKAMLWVRGLNAEEARALPGTEDVSTYPIWSPDSHSLAFFAEGKLKRIEASGGPAQTLCDAPTPFSGIWTNDNQILFGGLGVLESVSASGGTPKPLTALDPSRGELAHELPAMLPDGRHFLYSRLSLPLENSGVYVGSLDAKPEQQAGKKLLSDASTGFAYVPSSETSGFVVFVRGTSLATPAGTLMAQPFDSKRLEFTGEAVPVAEQVFRFSASPNGVLAFRTGAGQGASQLTWYDRNGSVLGTPGDMGDHETLALSPDASRVAYTRGNDLWILNLASGNNTKFTFGNPSRFPAWSADGSHIVFGTIRSGGYGFYQKASDLSGQEEQVYNSREIIGRNHLSRDGQFLLYDDLSSSGKGGDISVLPLGGSSTDRKPVAFLRTDAAEGEARFSPDGRWVAYQSNQNGKDEVFVLPFDPKQLGSTSTGGLHQISKDGGTVPHWSGDGKEIFYLAPDGSMMFASITVAGGALQGGTPQNLFKTSLPAGSDDWDVAPDGKRFLMAAPAAQASSIASPIHVILNWPELLKR